MTASPVPPRIAAIERPVDALMKWYFCKAILTTFGFPVAVLLFYVRFRTLRYRFDAEGIHMRWGVLFRHEIVLNYSRIQDIHLHSNFVERWLGLARIEIQTAAGSSNAEMTLEGLDDPEGMRNFLYSRMRGAVDERPGPAAAAASSAEPLATVLTEIAGELRAIRQTLEARGAAK